MINSWIHAFRHRFLTWSKTSLAIAALKTPRSLRKNCLKVYRTLAFTWVLKFNFRTAISINFRIIIAMRVINKKDIGISKQWKSATKDGGTNKWWLSNDDWAIKRNLDNVEPDLQSKKRKFLFANGPGDRGSIPGQVISKIQKWYLMPPCLALSIIRWWSRVK